jgi:hypothetical protein
MLQLRQPIVGIITGILFSFSLLSLRLATESVSINEQIAYWTSLTLFIGSIALYWSGLHILWGIFMSYVALIVMLAADGFSIQSDTISIITDIGIIITVSIVLFIYVTSYKSHRTK